VEVLLEELLYPVVDVSVRVREDAEYKHKWTKGGELQPTGGEGVNFCQCYADILYVCSPKINSWTQLSVVKVKFYGTLLYNL